MAGYRDVLEGCLCLHLRQAARVVTQELDDALRPMGLRSTQFTVLAVLAEHGDLPVNSLAEEVVADRTTLTRVLDRLVDLRLVSRKASRQDLRSVTVRITAKGKRLAQKAMPVWAKVQKGLARRLGAPRVKRLLKDLEAASHPKPE